MSFYKKMNILILVLLGLAACFCSMLSLECFRNFLIASAERFLVHRPLTHEVWHERLFAFWQLRFLILCCLIVLKFFSIFFAVRIHDSFINFVRVLACMMVFILHTSIFTTSGGTPLFTNIYIRLLQTPAWGGVWIFFILGGYLAGKSFSDGRYEIKAKSLARYYSNKFFKILVPTFCFLFLCYVFAYPLQVRDNPAALLSFLTLTYNGTGPLALNGTGAAWYVFTLVHLYLLTPFFHIAAEKLSKKNGLLFCASAILLLLGLFYRYYAIKFGWDWYSKIYTPFYANIDLFFGGILIDRIARVKFKNQNCVLLKDLSIFALLSLVCLNSLYYGNMFIYQILCPSFYLLTLGAALIFFSDEKWTNDYSSFFEKALAAFAGITFEFYLFHSLIYDRILPAFKEQNVFLLHAKLLIVGFVLTTICAIGFNRIFARRKGSL